MLIPLAVADSVGTPLWVYLFGAIGSIAAVLIGTYTLYSRVRQERDKEVRERSDNTKATENNTDAINRMSEKLDAFAEATNRRFQEQELENERRKSEIRSLNDRRNGR